MKIESKHGTKIPKYAVAAALLAATTVIGGCDETLGKNSRIDPEVEYMGDTTVCEDYWGDDDDDTNTSVTESSNIDLSSVGGAVNTAYGLPSEQFSLFMSKIDEVEEGEPGAYKYAIGASKDRNTETYFFVLMTVKGVYTTCYAVSNGELVELDSNPGDLKVSTKGALSYEEIKRLPCLVDTSYLLHDEFTETGIVENLYTPHVDSIEDGDYYGEIIGITEDGSKVLLKIGKPVVFDYNHIENEVAPGGEIGFKDFLKTNDKVEFEDKHFGTVVTSATYNFESAFYLSRYTTNRGYTDKMFMYYDFNCWVDDYVIIELPLAEDCKVYNYDEYFKYGKEYDPNWDENGDPMTHTQYLVQLRKNKGTYPHDGGWIIMPSFLRTTYKSEATVYSVIVVDGQAKVIEMSAHVY